MKREIKKAIKAAGLNADNFRITSDEFESELTNIAKGNAEANKVVKALRKAGHKVGGYKAGYGMWVYQVNVYRHAGHSFDFNNPASIHHY